MSECRIRIEESPRADGLYHGTCGHCGAVRTYPRPELVDFRNYADRQTASRDQFAGVRFGTHSSPQEGIAR